MQELLILAGFFGFAVAAAYLLNRMVAAKPQRKASAQFLPGQPVRLRTEDGLYRARFVATRTNGLALSAPIQRDRYVPIRIGEWVKVEIPTSSGVHAFRSEVIARDVDAHEITVAMPAHIHFEDRRERRRTRGAGRAVRVEENDAWLADIADNGVCITLDRALKQGERVRVDLEGREPAFAWVLDCEPNTGSGKGKHRVRARFEEGGVLTADPS